MPSANVDTILLNGLLWTGDVQLPYAEALAVDGGRIVAVGSSAEIMREYSSPNCIDLQGRRLLPGLHDSHMHLIGTGMMLRTVDLIGCKSIGELQARFISFNFGADKTYGQKEDQADTFLIGRGFLQDGLIEQCMPTRYDLDAVSINRPIIAIRACGHVLVCNSKVLQMAGISKGFGQVDGGEIGYSNDGEPDGIFSENAMDLIYALMPPPTESELQDAIEKATAECLRLGITTAHSNDFGNDNWDLYHCAYAAAAKDGNLKVRLNHQMLFDKPEDVAAFVSWRENNAASYGLDPEYFCYGSVKVMCDGSLGGRTAALSEPYADDPDTSGVTILKREQITAILSEAFNHGFQLCGHAIGDAAIRDLIEAIGDVVPQDNRLAARSRVIHAQITTPEILKRMQELHIHCDIQPLFVATDYSIVASRVGREKAQTSYAWATMRRMGITTSGGSDAPVEPLNPFYGIYCAVTRQTAAGEPPGGWLPEERLTVEEALQLYTYDGAYAAGIEEVVGRLKPGQYADFILLDRDIFSIPHEEIKDICVLTTWVGGERVHDTARHCPASEA